MKRLIPAGLLVLSGIVMLALGVYMEMTGLVLLLLGLAAGAWAMCYPRAGRRGRTALQLLVILASGGVMVLMACMGLVTDGGRTDWDRAETAEYAVVLGAAVREDGSASRIMRERCRAALHLMERNPTVTVILSGGQGEGEPMSEAACMEKTLMAMGADPSRLLLEEQSTTTRENLLFSGRIIEARGGTDRPIAVVTSEFHQRRAGYIGKTLGLDTCPVGADTERWFYRVNYTLREVFAFLKAAVQHRMD